MMAEKRYGCWVRETWTVKMLLEQADSKQKARADVLSMGREKGRKEANKKAKPKICSMFS